MSIGDLFGDRGADFSHCGRYRYLLWRRWGTGPVVVFCMHNPSTADASQDDPTIRRCVGFARDWGFGALRVVNLYAYRATHPRELDQLGADAITEPIAPGQDLHNDIAILAAAASADRIVAAWGARPGPSPTRAGLVHELLAVTRKPLVALGLTAGGEPRHPLYVRADSTPIPFPSAASA